MKTVTVKEFERESESANLLSSMRDHSSTSTVVAMVGCMLSLFVMLCA
jgi:hypothetical protein